MADEISTQTESKRLRILEDDEIEAVYGMPVFDNEDRAFYFALSPPERAILSQLHGTKSSVYYILQLGYFRARQQFFVFNLQQVAADAQYVQRRYFSDAALVDLDISKVTRLKQVNQRISSDGNEHIKVKRRGCWHLPYSRVDEEVNDPFFESLA